MLKEIREAVKSAGGEGDLEAEDKDTIEEKVESPQTENAEVVE